MCESRGKRFLMFLISFSLIIGNMRISQVGVADKEYSEEEIYSKVWNYDYTGDVQEFIVPMDGNYKVQLWGAEGGKPSDNIIKGGKGAYVEGHIKLNKGEKIEVRVGGHPGISSIGGYNGGGNGGIDTDKEGTFAGGGGGSSDIRRDGNGLLDRVAVAAGGGGGGIVIYGSFNNEFNSKRNLLSGGGAGGRDIGQIGGNCYYGYGINSYYKDTHRGQGGGGTQINGGKSDSKYGNNGELGKGGDGAYLPSVQLIYSVSGGGGAGLYGGGSAVASDWYSVPTGGGGSSFIQNLERYNWSTGWEAQPGKNGGNQNGNEGNGYVRITKSNDPPVLTLSEKAIAGGTYHSDDYIKYAGTIKDIDNIGGDIKIYSEIDVNTSGIIGTYKQEHGRFRASKDEQYFTAQLYLPYHSTSSSTKTPIRFWAEDSEGLKSEIMRTDIQLASPKNIKIDIRPDTTSWVEGSYKVYLNVKSTSDIKDITTSSGKINMTGVSNRREQEGYITVTENKPITVRVTDTRNLVEEKTFYVNNIQDLAITGLTKEGFNYKINNWGDEDGIKEDLTKWFIDVDNKEAEINASGFTGNIGELKPNEKVNMRYEVFNNLAKSINGITGNQYIYSIAQQPVNGSVSEITKNSVKIKHTPSELNKNKPRYQFKVIETTPKQGGIANIVTSVIVNEGEEIELTGLVSDTEYRVESCVYNGNNRPSSWERLKDSSGNDLRFRTKGSLEADIVKLEDWISSYVYNSDKSSNFANVSGELRLNKDNKLKAELKVGSDTFLISEDMLGTSSSSTTFNIEIRSVRNRPSRIYKDNRNNSINHYILELNNKDDIYDVVLFTTTNGYREKHDVGWLGIDTKGPESKSKAIFKQITKDKGILTLPTKDIYDISTPNHEILVDYGMGKMLLFPEKLITYKKPMTIKLYDKLGHMSNLAWSFDPDGGYDEGQDNPDIDAPEEKDPEYKDDNLVEVEVPKGGTHMQNSLDGVTWSIWEARKDKVKVALPTGDGKKSVFVRTGVELLKETPVYDVAQSQIEMIKQKGGEILPLDSTRIYNYIVDLTAPNLEIRTMDNMLIAINGNITFLLDVVDNLDKKPNVKIEILERDRKGVLKNTPIFSREVQISEGSTTGSITPSKLAESKTDKGKLQPYTLRVTAWDKANNRTVKHLNFYVKNK